MRYLRPESGDRHRSYSDRSRDSYRYGPHRLCSSIQ
jgi:hypothetical protein